MGVVLIAGHFFFGPLRLIQEHMEAGDMEGAEKVIAYDQISQPALQTHPFGLFTLKGNIAMMKNDFDGAELNMRKGLDLGMPMKEAEGASLFKWVCWPCRKMISGKQKV